VITALNGVVTEVDDHEIMAAKREIDRSGIGCEPASAASLAGLKRLVNEGVIQAEQRVVCILTGHLLKDPDAVTGPDLKLDLIEPTVDAVRPYL
jgi:threonine synthase